MTGAHETAGDLPAGPWILTGNSGVPGWLPIPPDPEDGVGWVRARTDELRAGWGRRWQPAHEEMVPALLGHGLATRPAEAVHVFQLWPVAAPIVAQVRTWVGYPPEGAAPRPGNGIPYEAEGLGAGLQTVQREQVDGIDGVGISVVFACGQTAVAASLLPTVPQLLPVVIQGFHAFVQSLTLRDPAGAEVRADLSATFPEVTADASWLVP